MPPSEPPRSSRSRKPKPPPKPRPSAQNAQAYVSQGRAVEKAANRQRQAQRARQQTQRAAPLSPVKLPPANVDKPQGRAQAKPLASTPPKNIRAGKPVVSNRQQRSLAVAAYNQLPSHAAKVAHVKAAQKRISQGKGTVGDKAVVHAHQTRVQGNQKVARAVAAFNVLKGEQVGGTGKGLHLAQGTTVRDGYLYDAKGKRLRRSGPTAADVKKQGTVANLPSVGAVAATLGPIATKGLRSAGVPKVIANIPKDAGELAVTSPTAVARTIDVAIHDPKKALKEQVQPYKDLAKNPKKFIENKPVTAALMLNPAARAPGRIVGKLARTAGKQTLRREAAVLENTALREARTGSRSAGRRAVQAARDKRAAARGEKPQVTARQIDRRVDESYASGQRYAQRVTDAVGRNVHKIADEQGLKGKDRKQFVQDYAPAARSVGNDAAQRRFAEEFGATARVENGKIVENPNATSGHLHGNVEEARAVAAHLNAKNPTVRRGHGNILSGDPVGRLYSKEKVPVNYVVRKVGQDKHVVIPEQIADRLRHHQSVGSTQARGAKILRTSRTMFTRSVLPYRPSWLSGQAVEGSVRAAIKQAGPTSFIRAKRFTAALERQNPGSGKAFLDRASPAGLIGRHQFESPNRTLKEEFPGSNVARALTDLGRAPGIKQVRDLNRHVTDAVFNKLNAKFLEGVPQTAMLGKVLKDSPLMERKLVGLTRKAMDQAARGGIDTHTTVELYRELQKSYGKYEGYSPHIRELISHWTPFLPWYLNTARFLLSTLPKDHPIATGLIANMDAATEDWRRQQGLSFRDKTTRVPGFMLGGYPISGDSLVGKAMGLKKDKTYILRIGHYTPAGIGSDVLGVASGAPLPQFSGFYNALLGLDWKNEPLKHENGKPFSDGEKFIYGLTQLAEAMIPLSGQVSSVTGVPGMQAPAQDKGEALKKLVRPLSVVERKNKPSPGAAVSGVDVKGVDVKPVEFR